MGAEQSVNTQQSVKQCKQDEPAQKTFIAYHGTSWENARKIARDGFQPSRDGKLGSGVYVAKKDKASRFAENYGRHGGEDGILVKCEVTVDNPKYLKGGDAKTTDYQAHDAIRTNYTSTSTNPEWCVRNAKNVKPIEMTRTNRATKKWHACKTPGCQYQVNDNPAYRNVKPAIDHQYCCSGCRLYDGKVHGGWCQKVKK